jgi:hypothetical protein
MQSYRSNRLGVKMGEDLTLQARGQVAGQLCVIHLGNQ